MDDDQVKAVQLAAQSQRLTPSMLPIMLGVNELVMAWVCWSLQDKIPAGSVIAGLLIVWWCWQLVSVIHEWMTKRYVIPAAVVDAPVQEK